MSSKILSKEFELLKDDLIKAYDAKGMRASGKFADSLEVRVNGLTAQLWGESYAQKLETGRRPGAFQPISAIEQWIKDKGIANRIQGEISISSLAFLIARKIEQRGWKREEYGGVELISEVVTDVRIQKIIDEVGVEQAMIYSTEIINLTKELAI
ncbi:hypothetical protein [Flavobacterium sp.]|jgi:hypothetical protein|uniref:hypothetical protein n=1 Tax=Flavobacterium sp. TaxID=239 RepID=UPI0037BFB3ED